MSSEKELKSIKTLLIVLVVIVVFCVLKLLSFIFIPLVLAFFIALIFLPLMRNLNRRNVPRAISLILVLLIIGGVLTLGTKLIQLTSREILSANTGLFENIRDNLKAALLSVEDYFLLNKIGKEGMISSSIQKLNIPETLFNAFRTLIDSVSNGITILLTTVFFLVLLLSGSIDVQEIMNKTLYQRAFSSVKIFREIEQSLVTFLKVKFLVSVLSGIGVGLACLFFHINFPLFWGLLAFALHFVQMVGALAVIVLLSLFAFVEIQVPGILTLFILTITGIQLLFGSVLEPILMGRSFSINTITILIMLMFWGYIWGGVGLILSVPITVFLKSVFEHFPNTKVIAEIMSGNVKNPFANRMKRKILKRE
jgi:predicted PurR-regulated permease PerM